MRQLVDATRAPTHGTPRYKAKPVGCAHVRVAHRACVIEAGRARGGERGGDFLTIHVPESWKNGKKKEIWNFLGISDEARGR